MRNPQFNPNRFWHLVRNDLFSNFRSLLIAGGAAIGLLLFINFFTILGGEVFAPREFYCLMLFIGGYIITSVAYNDLHHPQKSYVYLTLPASNEEKFLSKLLLTSVGFIFAAMLLYLVFSILMSLVSLIVFGESYPIFNPLDRVVWICNGVYFITQSIFLLGAVIFRKNTLIKTLLSLWLIASALSIFAGIVFRITFWEFFDGWNFIDNHFYFSSVELDQKFTDFFTGFGKLMAFCFKWLIAPVLWLVTYLRLEETEV